MRGLITLTVFAAFYFTSYSSNYINSNYILPLDSPDVSVDSSEVIEGANTSVTPKDSTKKTTITNDINVKGVAVSPSHFHLHIKPGEEKTVKVKITNSTDSKNSFRIRMVDFAMDNNGKTVFLDPNDSNSTAISRWANIAPTFVEMEAGESKQINLTVVVPSGQEGYKAAWGVLMVEQEKPRETIDVSNSGGNSVAFGVIPTFAFGVYVYQNPPNVKNTSVEITGFKHEMKDTLNTMKITATNTGDGIAYCTSYIDVTNLKTGYQKRLLVKRFTILPGISRDFLFLLPDDLPPGEYGAIGVIDFQEADEIQAAKTKFVIN